MASEGHLNGTREQYWIDILSGRRLGAWPATLRACLGAAEGPFLVITQVRNWLYDRRVVPRRRLPRPVISVGNLTTGGTGKTPIVCWLAQALAAEGRKPAVLLRGYKSSGGISDEQSLIAASGTPILAVANPSRVSGAANALEKQPDTDLFILDDGLQHRRVRRDLEIVLISATEPWGMGHLLPRGLLRESISGLKRADAVVVTHSDEISAERLFVLELNIKAQNYDVPIYHAEHHLTSLAPADGRAIPVVELGERPYLVACGIGQPHSFVSALQKHGVHRVGRRFFDDHHRFTADDVASLRMQAVGAGGTCVIVTEKDWTKLREIPEAKGGEVPFLRAQMRIEFREKEGEQLLDLVRQRSRRK